MAGGKAGSANKLDDPALIERVQSILINAAEGRRSIGDDSQYTELRKTLVKKRFETPPLVATHPSVDSFTAYIRGIKDKPERVQRIRAEFEPLLRAYQRARDAEVSSTAWTGLHSRTARLQAVQNLLPLAQVAVEGLIATLSEPGGNGGPILDEREEALLHLRALHSALGTLLSAVDAGHFEDELGLSLAADAARYAKRAAHALRNDPMPYVSSALLLGIFSACSLPGIGGYLSGVALTVQKHAQR